MKKMSFTLILVVLASISIAGIQAACPNTEVYFVESEQILGLPECICNDCSWRMFADLGMNLTSSLSIEAPFVWDSSAGYGQYICVDGNSVVAKDMDVLVLPPGE